MCSQGVRERARAAAAERRAAERRAADEYQLEMHRRAVEAQAAAEAKAAAAAASRMDPDEWAEQALRAVERERYKEGAKVRGTWKAAESMVTGSRKLALGGLMSMKKADVGEVANRVG